MTMSKSLFGVSSRPSDEHGVEELLKQVQQRSLSCSDEDRKELDNIVKRVREHKKPNNVVDVLSKKFSIVKSSISASASSNNAGIVRGANMNGSSHHSASSLTVTSDHPGTRSFNTTTAIKSSKALALEQSLAAAAAAATAPRSTESSSLNQNGSHPDVMMQSPLQTKLFNAKNKTADLFRNFSSSLVLPTGQQQQQQELQQESTKTVGQLLRGFVSSPRPATATTSTVPQTLATMTNDEGVLLRDFKRDPSPTIVVLPPLATKTENGDDEKETESKQEGGDKNQTVNSEIVDEEAQDPEDDNSEDNDDRHTSFTDESAVESRPILIGESDENQLVVVTTEKEKMIVDSDATQQEADSGTDYYDGEEKKIEHI